ncbi:MAG: hypothetical protein MPW15_09970 [Candidatus Manganitrophus sp.]|nr:hypothetical protein [Candidatus Manganitrophus sp.]
MISFLKKRETLHLLARLFGTSDFLWEDFLRIQFENLLPLLDQYKGKEASDRERGASPGPAPGAPKRNRTGRAKTDLE